MICNYHTYQFNGYIGYVSSSDRQRPFDIADRCAAELVGCFEGMVSRGEEVLSYAKQSHATYSRDIDKYAGKISEAERNLKNTSTVIRVNKIGLDGKLATDQYGNQQYTYFNNPEYPLMQQELEKAKLLYKEAVRGKEWAEYAMKRAKEIIEKYSRLKEAAQEAVHTIEEYRSDFVSTMQSLERSARDADAAAKRALEINFYKTVKAQYNYLPLIRKE